MSFQIINYGRIKRIIDFICSLLLLIILIPVFVSTSFFIIIGMGFPVFFKQNRIGFNNRTFVIYKFRTMKRRGFTNVKDNLRITRLGRILRVTRIDELPQLYNILKGDLSFIGPRPLLSEYLPFYKKEELRRHEIRPGLTGLSQINGSYPSWEKQFRLDVTYVDTVSFKLDVIILVKTVKKLLLPSKKLISGNSERGRFDDYRKAMNQY